MIKVFHVTFKNTNLPQFLTKLLLFILLLHLSSCASIHPGINAVRKKNINLLPLKVSTLTIENDVNDPFQLLELTFENASATWIKIYKTEIKIEKEHVPNVSVVLRQDLRDWAQSKKVRKKSTIFSEKMAQLGLIAGGSIAGVFGAKANNSMIRDIGFMTALAGVLWAAEDVLREAFFNGPNTYSIPETHLYQPFAVPGKMYIRRWVLLNKPVGPTITHATLDLETVEGVKESYELLF